MPAADERQRLPFFRAAAGAADAMDVVVVGSRDVIVDDVRDVGDVEPACGNVGRHEDLEIVVLEGAQGALALGMVLVAVDGFGLEPLCQKVLRNALDAMLGLAEYEHLAEFGLREELFQDVYLCLAALDMYDVLLDVFGGILGLDRYPDRLAQKVLDDLFDVRRKGCREKESVARLGHPGHDESHVVDESHVEHAVRLVEDDGLEFGEDDELARDQILDPAGRADDEIVFVFQVAYLFLYRNAADATDGEYAHAFGEGSELGVDLDGQLAGRSHDEDLLLRIRADFVDERDEKSRRLAGAGVGDADDVGALEDVRDGAVLDRRRELVAFFKDAVAQNRVDLEISERMLGLEMFDLLGDDGFLYEAGKVDALAFSCAASAAWPVP